MLLCNELGSMWLRSSLPLSRVPRTSSAMAPMVWCSSFTEAADVTSRVRSHLHITCQGSSAGHAEHGQQCRQQCRPPCGSAALPPVWQHLIWGWAFRASVACLYRSLLISRSAWFRGSTEGHCVAHAGAEHEWVPQLGTLLPLH